MGGSALAHVGNCESDLRVGGRYRFVYRSREGSEFEFHGEYREILPPQRLVRTFVCSPMPEHEAHETLTLEQHGMQTMITTITVHESIEGHNRHLASGGMEAGMTEGYARLDELLAALQGG